MKDIAIPVMGISVVGFALYVQYLIIHDCGLIALLQGAEWYWMFGGCR